MILIDICGDDGMKLADICEINPRSEVLDDNTLVSFVAMPDVSEDGKINVDTHRTYGEVKKGFTNFKEGDVLFAKITPCMENGKGALATGLENGFGFGSTEFHVLRPNAAIVLGQWLYYLTSWSAFRKDAEKHMTGSAGQKRVPKSFLEKYEVGLPPIDEQKYQVLQLNRIRNIIDARQQQLSALDDLIKARFVEMFGDPVNNEKGWNTRPLLSMGSCKNGMNFHYDDSGVEINCLGVGDFKDYSIIADTASLPTVSLNEMPSSEYLLRDDDIVFVRSNGNKKMVGRSVAVYPGAVPTTFSGFCIRYRRDDDAVITPYLLRVLKAESMRQKMYGRGANIQNLNQQTLSSLDIPVPPKAMQEQFATFVARVDKSKITVKKALDEAQLLFDSMMQLYFG